ncbi:uncharacterized protein LOC110448355 [Mizuhopecten yessoensis]|uniref:uncharacterized protein LOC110448355 n=1 Tax=Mizuhopecten yessoensis TaxID=6573 RepID=UPI000B45B5A4|nr:uncharacterized protein LOC110448355 [Mizuhopecten yessoensis]
MLHNVIIFLCVLKIITISSSLEACEDVNTAVCHMMAAKDSSLCSKSCLRSLCKRFCGTCPAHTECFKCREVNNPLDCNTTTTCAKLDETCIVSEYSDSSSHVLYRMGCAPKQICVDHFDYNDTTKTTETQTPVDQVNGACCGTNLCNNQTPRSLISAGNTDNTSVPASTEVPNRLSDSLYARSESECADMWPDICNTLLQTVPSICEVPCVAALVCPRTCLRCLSCHTCARANRPSGCNQTMICEQGQLCYSIKTLSSMLEHGYRLGCMDKYICDRFHKEAPIAFGRRRQSLELSLHGGCCSTDLCNNRELRGDVATVSASAASSTSTMTTSSDSGTSTTARSCPASRTTCSDDFTRHGTDCYHTSRQSMDWESAKGYCHEKCAALVKFPTSDFALQVLQQLYVSGGLAELYFMDAQYNLHTDSWKWSSTGEAVPNSLLSPPINTTDMCGTVGVRRYYHGIDVYFKSTNCLSKLPPICQKSLSK